MAESAFNDSIHNFGNNRGNTGEAGKLFLVVCGNWRSSDHPHSRLRDSSGGVDTGAGGVIKWNQRIKTKRFRTRSRLFCTKATGNQK